MAYRVVRLRREARRSAKLEELFQAKFQISLYEMSQKFTSGAGQSERKDKIGPIDGHLQDL